LKQFPSVAKLSAGEAEMCKPTDLVIHNDAEKFAPAREERDAILKLARLDSVTNGDIRVARFSSICYTM
jgi:hypothetical protein